MLEKLIYLVTSGIRGLLLFWCPWGRDSRVRYANFVFFFFFISIGWGILNNYAYSTHPHLKPFAGIMLGWLILAGFMAAVRRGHDVGYSGWYTLFHFWRFAQYPCRVLLMEEGDWRPNKYGPAPKE